MEAHLRKITRSLGNAVSQLEKVSVSEKTVSEVDAEWMTQFHAGIAVPNPLDDSGKFDFQSASNEHGGKVGMGETDLRWSLLCSTWLPLLRDLYRTVGALDREESALRAAELEKEKAEAGPGGTNRKSDQAPPRPPKGLLSLRDYTVIHTALEVVVHWGLAPVLEPGVGVFDCEKRPRSRAVKVSRRLLHYWQRRSSTGKPCRSGLSACGLTTLGSSGAAAPLDTGAPGAGIDAGSGADAGAGAGGVGGGEVAQAQLALCTSVVQGIVTTGQFMPMLMPLYLPDLLAARLQLVYGRAAAVVASAAAAATAGAAVEAAAAAPTLLSPASAGDGDLNPNTVANGDRPGTPPSTVATTGARHTFRQTGNDLSCSSMSSLRAMLKDVGPRQVMGALRQLLSQGARAPPWLRQRAGRILSEIVLRPGGVQATLEVYLAGLSAVASGGDGGGDEGGDSEQEGDGTRAYLRVAKLLATPPKRVAPRVYVSRVAPQLAEMLHFDGQQRAMVTRVVVMIVGRLSESMPGDTRRLVLWPLLRPLLRFWGPEGKQLAQLHSKWRAATAAAEKNPPEMRTTPRKPSSDPRPIIATDATATIMGPAVVGPGAPVSFGAARRKTNRGGGGGGGGGGGVGYGDVVSTEEALERSLEDLEKLLTAAPVPPTLLGLLSGMGVTVPLFRLYCFCATSKSRNLQSTKTALSVILPCSTTAASDLVAGLLPVRDTGWGGGTVPRFSPGPTGGTVLRAAPSAAGIVGGSNVRTGGPARGPNPGGAAAVNGVATGGGSGAAEAAAPPTDESLLGMEAALKGLGLDPETLRLVGDAAAAVGVRGTGLEGAGESGAGLIGALVGLKEAEGMARAAAEVLEGLGEGSSVAGKVFDILLRRYLSLRDASAGATPTTGGAATAVEAERRILRSPPFASAAADAAAVATEQHAVMASVVVLAERLGARVFGTGMQMLSCIRLVLEHEEPRRPPPPPEATGGSRGSSVGGGGRSSEDGGCGGSDRFVSGGGDQSADAAARVARMEPAEVEGTTEGAFDLRSMAGIGGANDDRDGGDGGDTLCSVVLALLTTILELGEEERTVDEEAELRAMLGPLKGLAAGHRRAEVAEMSASLCASILSRGLTPEERREEAERVKLRGDGGGGGGGGVNGREARTANMMAALDAAEEDLRSEAVPMRARGVVTLTRLLRATLDGGSEGSSSSSGVRGGGRSGGGGGDRVNMDVAVTQRLLDTYARMAGDADSYVFLAAVQGLAALADALPWWCIPRLVGLFTAASSSDPRPGQGSGPLGFAADVVPRTACAAVPATGVAAPFALSQRLKIGEAVLLSARRCGEAMPKYAHFYVNAFVVAARERSPSCSGGGGKGHIAGGPPSPLESKERHHFRASCLSNLAEVCQLLGWSLGRFSQDIVGLAVGVLSMETGASEEATLARRGASFLLGRLLRGAGGDVLRVVQAAELRAAYRALRRAADGDRDEVTRSHARSGLACLDIAIRGQIFPASGDDGSGGGGEGGGRGGLTGAGRGDGSSPAGHHPGITVL